MIVCLSVYFCLSVFIFVHLSVCTFVCLSMSTCISALLPSYLPVCPPYCLPVFLPALLPANPPACLLACLNSCRIKGVGPNTTLAWPGWKQPDIPMKVDTGRLETRRMEAGVFKKLSLAGIAKLSQLKYC